MLRQHLYFFETIFAQYIGKKHPEYKKIADQVISDRIRRCYLQVGKVSTITDVIKIRNEKGFVPDNYLRILRGEHNAKVVREDMLQEKDVTVARKYALAQVFVPTMVKKYNEDPEAGKEKIRKYLECTRNNDFDGALAVFGMNLSDKDKCDKMFENVREHIIKYGYEEEPNIVVDRDSRE